MEGSDRITNRTCDYAPMHPGRWSPGDNAATIISIVTWILSYMKLQTYMLEPDAGLSIQCEREL